MSLAAWLLFGAGVPLATGLMLALAPRLGLVDAPAEAPERKLQGRAVPAVGGPALLLVGLLAVLVLPALDPGSGWSGGPSHALLVRGGPALVLAFLVGLVDDRLPGGLTPLAKVALQALAAAPLVGLSPGPGELLLFLAAIASMNLVNTFDNSDGCLAALAGAGLWPLTPALGLGLFAFLPFNLGRSRWGARPGDARRGAARAYLGDSGSHLIGMLVVLHPAAVALLFLPALDLLRVVLLRRAAGQAAWVGDRRHLAQRFEALGWPSHAIALLMVAIALPMLVAGDPWVAGSSWQRAALGAAATSVLFLGAVRLAAARAAAA